MVWRLLERLVMHCTTSFVIACTIAGCATATPEPEPEPVPDAGEAVPRTALIALTSTGPTAATLSVIANTGFHDVVTRSIELAVGDRLRLRGQVEWTNDFAQPVAGIAELTVDGTAIAPRTTQNNLQLGTHHTALYQSATFTAPEARSYTIALRFAAARGGASPAVTIEGAGYSQLVVEHYRTFAGAGPAADAGAYWLRAAVSDTSTALTTYGSPASTPEAVFEVAPSPRRGELVRLSGHTTSRWRGAQAAVPQDMHGSGLHARTAAGLERVGGWATENTPWDVNVTPLWTDGVHAIADDATYTYVATMHGVSGRGGLVEGAEGHVTAMVFAPAAALDGEPRWALAASDAVVRDEDLVHAANSPAVTVVERSLRFALAGVVRLEGTVQLAHASGVQSPSCRATLEVFDGAGVRVAQAGASKYLTPSLAGIALRDELVLPLAPGDYRTTLTVHCLRSGENTGVRIVGGGARILADVFEPL